MQIFIDKDNFESYLSQNTNGLFNQCLNLLKNQLDVYFNFKLEEANSIPGLIPFLQLASSGVGSTQMKFGDNYFPIRPIDNSTYKKFSPSQLSSCYLLNEESANELSNGGAVISAKPGDEFNVFNKLFLLNNDYKFEKKFKIGSVHFDKWTDLKKYATPLTDIIFIDSFILSDYSLIGTNLYSYIKILVSECKHPVNIIIYTNYDKISVRFDDLSSNLKREVKSVTGFDANFTLVKYREQRGVTSLGEHDRTILTNYQRIYSGDTFNYFLSNGQKITKGREIHYSSLADRENFELAQELINDIQQNIKEMPTGNIEGDKKSNYLKFK
jgi:hypothetical protein